jgi:hypothetical protein
MIASKEKEKVSDIENYTLAINERDLVSCSRIIDPIRQIECRETIQAIYATASGSIESCQSLTLT